MQNCMEKTTQFLKPIFSWKYFTPKEFDNYAIPAIRENSSHVELHLWTAIWTLANACLINCSKKYWIKGFHPLLSECLYLLMKNRRVG